MCSDPESDREIDTDMGRYTALTLDSRKVVKGALFAALPGVQVDGRSYITSAIEKGAGGILSLTGTPKPAGFAGEWMTSDNPRQTLSHLAAQFYKQQPAHICAITGTNGKTSIAQFTQQILQGLGEASASLGTLGLKAAQDVSAIAKKIAALTTPDTIELHAALAALADEGVSHLTMEASSHGLEQNRLDGVRLQAAGFSNLSQDHLDYHKTMEAYFEAKSRLFTQILPPTGTAVINADDPYGQKLIERCQGRNIIDYGAQANVIKILEQTPTPNGQYVRIVIDGRDYAFEIALVGTYQLMNVLCALGLVMAQYDGSPGDVIAHLSTLKHAEGRLDRVEGHPNGAAVYVDYAHTPDALQTVLKAIRPHVENRLLCIFGCGGNRDAAKRPQMGHAVEMYADIGILTDDNPRDEDPSAIRSQTLQGAPSAIEIPGRAEAIRRAIEMLTPGDVLIIAGKGHEQGQTISGETIPFCDKTIAENIIKELER